MNQSLNRVEVNCVEVVNSINNEGCENQLLWEKRLTLFLKTEYSLRKLQLIRSICVAVLLLNSAMLIFTLKVPQIIPAWLFTFGLASALLVIFSILVVIPLVNIKRKYKNHLSKRFYEHELNIEFTDLKVILRNRCTFQIVCQVAQ